MALRVAGWLAAGASLGWAWATRPRSALALRNTNASPRVRRGRVKRNAGSGLSERECLAIAAASGKPTQLCEFARYAGAPTLV